MSYYFKAIPFFIAAMTGSTLVWAAPAVDTTATMMSIGSFNVLYLLIAVSVLAVLALLGLVWALYLNNSLRRQILEQLLNEDKIRELHGIERAEKKILALLSRDAPLDDILRAVCKRISRQLPRVFSAIALVEKRTGELRLVAAPLIGKHVSDNEPPLYLRRLPAEPEDILLQELAFTLAHRIKRHIAPGKIVLHTKEITLLRDEQNQIVGILFFFVQPGDLSTLVDSDLISRVQALATLAINRKRNQEKIHTLAHYDSLTELPNRTSLHQRLHSAIARARRGEQRLALCFLDLDGFKQVNDVYGHDAGDLVLIETARRLKTLVRETDMLARLGGDEFVVVLEQLNANEDAARVAETIVHALQQPFYLDDEAVNLGTSVGIAVFPEDGLDWSTLLKRADAAMYQAKEVGNCYRYFAEEIQESIVED